MDVKTAFLNGNIEEELYMVQPEGFVNSEDAGKVCKLQRSIYGLKQASRRWNRCFDEVIKEFGFVQNKEESYIYKKLSGSSVSFLVLYREALVLAWTPPAIAHPRPCFLPVGRTQPGSYRSAVAASRPLQRMVPSEGMRTPCSLV